MLERLYIISNITYQQIVRQPIYYIILLASAALLFIAAPFSLFSFGKELNMMREVGLATITFAGIVIAILSTDFVVTSDIEKQTALLTLTKPLRRSEFIIGKFLGIIVAIFLATLFLTMVFLIVYWLKEGKPLINKNLWSGYYLKEGPSQIWKDTFNFFRTDGLLLIKGIYASFLLVTVITAVAVTLSLVSSLPIMAGSIVVFFIFGHISPYLHIGLVKNGSLLISIPAKIVYTLLPDLTNFNISSQVATLRPISLSYLGLITLYAAFWNAIILIVATMIFRRQEIK